MWWEQLLPKPINNLFASCCQYYIRDTSNWFIIVYESSCIKRLSYISHGNCNLFPWSIILWHNNCTNSGFLGDNGKQSIPPDGKTIKRCIIHWSPYWGNTQILREIATKAYGASVKYVNDCIFLHIYSLIQNKVVYSRPIF